MTWIKQMGLFAVSNSFDWTGAFAGAFVATVVAWFAKGISRWYCNPVLAIAVHSDEYGMFRTRESTYSDIKAAPAGARSIPVEEYGRVIQQQILSHATTDAIYLRLCIRNNNMRAGFAKKCSVFLTDIEYSRNGTDFTRLYFDSIALCWSYNRDADGTSIDIPHGISFFVDLMSTRKGKSDFVPAVRILPKAYAGCFKESGKYRFRVVAAAENAKPTTTTIDVEWNGKWNDVRFSVRSN